jgi:hypothetical protein
VSEKDQPEKHQIEQHDPADHLLQLFVQWATRFRIGLSVTLMTGGAVVTGTIIPMDRFAKRTKELFSGATGDEGLRDHMVKSVSVH